MEAELMGTSEGRGGGSGDDYGERRRGWCSAIAGEGEGDEGERGERCRGCWASSWCGWKRRVIALEQEVASSATRVQARNCFSSWQEEEDGVAPVGWARTGVGPGR